MAQETQDGFVVWLNRDNTEGRGPLYPGSICSTKATAIRLAERKGVQGSNADVNPCELFRINNQWYGPVFIKQPSPEDVVAQAKIDERAAIVQIALEAGLSEEEIQILAR